MTRRLYLAAGDSEDGQEARASAPDMLSPGWVVADEPDGAAAILAVDVDIDADTIKRAGAELRVVASIGPAVDEVAAADAGVRVVTVLSDADLSRITVAEYTVTL